MKACCVEWKWHLSGWFAYKLRKNLVLRDKGLTFMQDQGATGHKILGNVNWSSFTLNPIRNFTRSTPRPSIGIVLGSKESVTLSQRLCLDLLIAQWAMNNIAGSSQQEALRLHFVTPSKPIGDSQVAILTRVLIHHILTIRSLEIFIWFTRHLASRETTKEIARDAKSWFQYHFNFVTRGRQHADFNHRKNPIAHSNTLVGPNVTFFRNPASKSLSRMPNKEIHEDLVSRLCGGPSLSPWLWLVRWTNPETF